jgi:hypothetical protein
MGYNMRLNDLIELIIIMTYQAALMTDLILLIPRPRFTRNQRVNRNSIFVQIQRPNHLIQRRMAHLEALLKV